MSDTPSSQTRSMRPRPSRPILVYLGFLITVFVLPVLAFSGVLIQRQNESQLTVVETFTVATTRSVVQAVEREVAGMITTLSVLISSPSLADDDLAEFHGRSRLALQGTGAHMVVIDRDLNQLLNTRVAYGTQLGLMSDPGSAARTFSSADALVSPVFFGRTAQDWVFNVMRRYPNTDDAREVVILTQGASNLSNALLTRELPAGWHVALVDGTNTVVAASEGAASTGETLFIPLEDPQGSSLRWRERTVEDTAYKTITQRSILTGWYVVAWAPVAVVESPIRTSMLLLVLGGIAIIALAGIAATLVARQIARSVRGLARDARRVGAGESVSAQNYPVHELAVVSAALAEAGEKRKAAEAEAEFLMRELAHRSKNQLTVIGAMAKQTAQGTSSVAQFVESFQNRIYGLARSTDLLLAHGSGGIDLRELFKTQLDPFRPEDPSRIDKAGPAVRLNVQAAQMLGMAAHEMATNASKYGAFSGSDGRLVVRWHFVGETLHLSWREHTPEFVAPPEHKGFGTTVVKTMVAGTLHAQVERTIHPDGIEWCFDIPLSAIEPEAQPTVPEPE